MPRGDERKEWEEGSREKKREKRKEEGKREERRGKEKKREEGKRGEHRGKEKGKEGKNIGKSGCRGEIRGKEECRRVEVSKRNLNIKLHVIQSLFHSVVPLSSVFSIN